MQFSFFIRTKLLRISFKNGKSCIVTKKFQCIFADSREAAFVYAISAAGVAYSVTRACSRGELTDCSCDNRVRTRHPNNWQWGGCSEVISPICILFSFER